MKKLLLFLIIIFILIGFVIYDTYSIEEEHFSDNVLDAKVNSNYVYDQNQNVRQVKFDVDVPLNRYYMANSTPSAGK